MNAQDYFKKINDIVMLGTIRKTLTPDALEYLKDNINKKIEQSETNDIEVLLPFIVMFVYNEAYSCAVSDCLNILRSKK